MSAKYQRQMVLFAWLPSGAVSNFVKSQCVKEEQDREAKILQCWQEASAAFNQKTPRQFESISTQSIDPKYAPRLTAIRQDRRFGYTFSQLPVDLQMVEIDKLIACQTAVNLDYTEKLIGEFPPKLTFENILDICLSLDKTVPDVSEMRTAENSIIYSSENTDFRFLGAIQKPLEHVDLDSSSTGGIPTSGLLLLFGYGGSPVNVLKVGNRVFLNNGFHRVYALRKVGVTHIPVVVQQVSNPALEFPPSYQNIPKDYLLQAERLPIMRDYFDHHLSIELKTIARRRGIKVVWMSEPIDVPL